MLEAENREMKSLMLSMQAELTRREHSDETLQYANESVTSCKFFYFFYMCIRLKAAFVQQPHVQLRTSKMVFGYMYQVAEQSY